MQTLIEPVAAPTGVPSGSYIAAMEHLVEVVQELSHARTFDHITSIVRKAARHLTGADGATFVLRDGNHCHYADEDAIAPLWKGQRFPLRSCISGWVMTHAEPVVIEDIYSDPRIPSDAYRPTFVKSLAMVPIRLDRPIGAIGNYWATRHRASEDDLKILQALANVTSVALENADLYCQLQNKVTALEESNYELGRFAWIASHDLKSPLRAVQNLTDWLEEDFGDRLDGKGAEHMRALRQRVGRMSRLLDDVLEFASLERKTDGTKDLIDGRALFDDVLSLVDVPPGFRIVAEGDMRLRLPRLAAQRVLANLVDNAIKHHNRPEGRVTVALHAADDRIDLSVTDDGPGIPPEFHERIFELFQTLRPRDVQEGSGLGLALVRKVAVASGATVSVASETGRGATFTVSWPRLETVGGHN